MPPRPKSGAQIAPEMVGTEDAQVLQQQQSSGDQQQDTHDAGKSPIISHDNSPF